MSPLVANAEQRLIANAGMPFPINETPAIDVHQTYESGKPEEKSIPLGLCIATQRGFDPEKVHNLMSVTDAPPAQVVQHRGYYLIKDGHHRLMADVYNGKQSANVNVVKA